MKLSQAEAVLGDIFDRAVETRAREPGIVEGIRARTIASALERLRLELAAERCFVCPNVGETCRATTLDPTGDSVPCKACQDREAREP